MIQRLLPYLAFGAVGGALFGVFFGAFASVFRNGPPMMAGILESWPWFAAVGLGLGFGIGWSREGDRRRGE